MLAIPAIDIQNGQTVRLRQGNFEQITVYRDSPLSLAKKYYRAGLRYLHLVDLDGAKTGELTQLDLIKSIKSLGIDLQVGGGIRSLNSAQQCIEAGINKLILGSIAISDPQYALEIIDYCGAANIVIALDVRIEQGVAKPAIHGWQTSTDTNLWEVVDFYQQQGIKTILCTDIACDGMMNGPNFNLYEQAIQRFPTIMWQASGGIRHQQDMETLRKLGLSAAILGRVLYETDIDLNLEEFA